MSFGGGSSSTSSSSSTVWTGIANQLASTLSTSLKSLASGSSTAEGIKALTTSSEQQTKSGVANIKESAGASGMRFSSDLSKNIADYQTSQTTALNTSIANYQQTAVSNQLSALQEIISLGSGSGTTTGSQSGWNFAAKLLG
jgi:hypothetical protein